MAQFAIGDCRDVFARRDSIFRRLLAAGSCKILVTIGQHFGTNIGTRAERYISVQVTRNQSNHWPVTGGETNDVQSLRYNVLQCTDSSYESAHLNEMKVLY